MSKPIDPAVPKARDHFSFSSRGIIEVKGKGPMHVYLLEAARAKA